MLLRLGREQALFGPRQACLFLVLKDMVSRLDDLGDTLPGLPARVAVERAILQTEYDTTGNNKIIDSMETQIEADAAYMIDQIPSPPPTPTGRTVEVPPAPPRPIPAPTDPPPGWCPTCNVQNDDRDVRCAMCDGELDGHDPRPPLQPLAPPALAPSAPAAATTAVHPALGAEDTWTPADDSVAVLVLLMKAASTAPPARTPVVLPAAPRPTLTARQACERAGLPASDIPASLQIDSPRERAIAEERKYPHLWVPKPMRGQDNGQPQDSMTNTISCDLCMDYYYGLKNDDYVIRNAPSLEQSGWFPDHSWLTIQPYFGQRLGPALPLPWRFNPMDDDEWGCGADMSRSLTQILRHDQKLLNGLDHFLDRRVNVWPHNNDVRDMVHNRSKSLLECLTYQWRNWNRGPATTLSRSSATRRSTMALFGATRPTTTWLRYYNASNSTSTQRRLASRTLR